MMQVGLRGDMVLAGMVIFLFLAITAPTPLKVTQRLMREWGARNTQKWKPILQNRTNCTVCTWNLSHSVTYRCFGRSTPPPCALE